MQLQRTQLNIGYYLPSSVKQVMRNLKIDDNLHLTFLHLKEMPIIKSDSEERILAIVKEVAENFGPLRCKFTGVGLIKHESECLIALVDIERGAELYAQLVSKLKENWWEFRTHHDFLPHVTLRFNNKGHELVPLDTVRSYCWYMDHLTVEIKTISEILNFPEDIKVSEDISLKGENR